MKIEISSYKAKTKLPELGRQVKTGKRFTITSRGEVDAATFAHALSDTVQLARRYKLSAYDASYLELALRRGIPLATLDEDLQKAAK